jgi:processive 1,2-diacylglycerol beta-glucosyltransferase
MEVYNKGSFNSIHYCPKGYFSVYCRYFSTPGGRMIKLFDKETGVFLGAITEEQMRFMVDQLEEEGFEDRDYAISPMTLSLFEGEDADPVLVSMLRAALGDRDEMTISWQVDES